MARGVERPTAQRFVFQCLVALFAEDIGLLPKYAFTRLLEDCGTPEQAFDLIGGLFTAMNTEGVTAGGRFRGVEYFNGGVFAEPVSLELQPDEVNQLKGAATEDWSKVRPEIFGTIFEHSLDQKQRHAQGAHFTSSIDPWRAAIARADTVKQLEQLRNRMYGYRVLDPACGSGNFLYVAYRWLKRLEAELLEKLDRVSKRRDTTGRLGGVTARQFFGMDVNPFAVELAKVTMMIARKLAIDELHMDEQALPLDNLDANFRAGDALISGDGEPIQTPWPEADVVVGNPPFLGAKRMKPELGGGYVERVRRLYPDVPGMADYCVYWFRRAHDHLPACTPEEPFRGRAGLVGTQNIRNNKSREGGLDHVVGTHPGGGGVIVDAVDNQPWSGEANVHVSIANWVKRELTDAGTPVHDDADLLIHAKRSLWFKVPDAPGRRRHKRGEGPATKQYELDQREACFINAALSDQAIVSDAAVLESVTKPQKCFQGVVPGFDGFQLTHAERQKLIRDNVNNARVARPWLVGRDVLTGNGTPSRSVLDFAAMDQLEARGYAECFELAQQRVMPLVADKAAKAEGGSM